MDTIEQQNDLIAKLAAHKEAHELASQFGFRERRLHESLTDYQRELAKHIGETAMAKPRPS